MPNKPPRPIGTGLPPAIDAEQIADNVKERQRADKGLPPADREKEGEQR